MVKIRATAKNTVKVCKKSPQTSSEMKWPISNAGYYADPLLFQSYSYWLTKKTMLIGLNIT